MSDETSAPKPYQYLPLAEITDGHVDAYLRAYRESNNSGNIYRESVRAGLAAVQWPPADVTADHLPVLDAAEMREVPLAEVRVGDTITVSAIVTQGRASGVIEAADSGVTIRVHPPHVEGRVTVTRSVAPLPVEPGSEGTATVHGVKGVRVVLAYPESDHPWLAIHFGGYATQWVRAADLADYVPLVAGQEAGT